MQSIKILSSFHLALTLKKRMLNATGEAGVQVAMATMVIMAATIVTMAATMVIVAATMVTMAATMVTMAATMVTMAATMVTMVVTRDGFRGELNKLSTKNYR